MKINFYKDGVEIMSSEKQKTYKVSIEWEIEVKAKDYNDAILKGSDEWFFDYDKDHFKAQEINNE